MSLNSSLSMPFSNPQNNAPLKRRACDECRTRKLACSKEPDGCTRCVRESIPCHYSEQKQMGRPRKRHANGDMKEAHPEFQAVVPDFDPLPYFDDNFQIDSFADFEGLQSLSNPSEYPPMPSEEAQASSLTTTDDGRLVFHFGPDLPIDFGANDPISDSQEPVIPTDQESVKLGLGVFVGDHPAPINPGPPCSCLATMYLAMSSLQEFPNEVEAALATIRAAANTAQSSIRCPKCGHCAVTMIMPPIEAFQNTMLLGTILPIIANGYKRLLVMVDEETVKAKALGIKKVFRMSAYGGLCGPESVCAATKNHYDEAVMEPDEWRAAVRALLRVDVYGMNGTTPGLRGIISEMEQRQRLRHKEMHRLKEIGVSGHEIEQRKCLGEKDMLCLRILDTAKISIETLVIA